MRAFRTVVAGLAGALAVTVMTAVPADAATRDRCLNGTWTMSPAQATAYMNRLTAASAGAGGMDLRVVSGAITATFGGGRFTVSNGSYQVSGTGPNNAAVSATASYTASAPYSTRRGKVVVGPGTAVVRMGTMTMTIDGQEISVPVGDQTVNSPGARTPYTCSRTKLTWSIPVPTGGTVQAQFTRS
jgi:hypothetical protein